VGTAHPLGLGGPCPSCGGSLPLALTGQSAAGPAAVGIGFVPVHVHYRSPRFQRQPAVEGPPQPASRRVAPPVEGMEGVRLLSPMQTFLAPESHLLVAAIVDESSELCLGHRRAGDGEWADLDGMRPFFVVKDKLFPPTGAKLERAARHVSIASDG